MSFYTALTGLNAATAQLSITSNNIANVGTAGFKRSRADFGDIFATSPLQKAAAVIGQGVALKEVTQEFSQGNIQASSNSLDLAISGDGFFMLKSSDGLQNIYTRNGSFSLNDQYNVVNSAGQALQAASVDSSGKADLGNLNRLTVPKKTSGDAKQTSLVSLGLNFPADAAVITAPFSRANPASYNKTTALTVYDQGGNSYLATVYYAKTQNASQASPNNRWQTYVFIGENEVSASLTQATDTNEEKLYVNKYGQLKSGSQLSADQTNLNVKTMMFELNNLTDNRVSVPATVVGSTSTLPVRAGDTGIRFSDLTAVPTGQLEPLLTIDVDGSGNPVDLNMGHLRKNLRSLTGDAIAAEITSELNRAFGDGKFWDISSKGSQVFSIKKTSASGITSETNIDFITGNFAPNDDLKSLSTDKIVTAMNKSIFKAFPNQGIDAGYDPVARSFTFKSTDPAITLAVRGELNPATATGAMAFVSPNIALGLGLDYVDVDIQGYYPPVSGVPVTPNGLSIRAKEDQRYGLRCSFDSANKLFRFESGTTGDTSSVEISKLTPFGKQLLNLPLDVVSNDVKITPSISAVRGITSTGASCSGTTLALNVSSNFAVNSTNNKFVVTVNDVKGTVIIPPDNNYTMAGFKAALQKGINELESVAGSTVNGVTVDYDPVLNVMTFTSGTTGSDSFIQVSGDTVWGLSAGASGRGSTSSWIKPTQTKVVQNGISTDIYISNTGKETSTNDGFNGLPEWSPIYLHKGELTFNTAGKLISPTKGAQLDTVFLADGKGALKINIDYSKSTQFSSPFAVLSQSQDGAPEGDLIGVNIGDDGLVNASYSNGAQKSLGKIALVNFSNPTGLRQIGDSSFYASSSSGSPTLGEAGSAGFGTIRAGATERANVDLTQELVDLITGQRNFQAAAKAIETNTTLTQTIIQIRS